MKVRTWCSKKLKQLRKIPKETLFIWGGIISVGYLKIRYRKTLTRKNFYRFLYALLKILEILLERSIDVPVKPVVIIGTPLSYKLFHLLK